MKPISLTRFLIEEQHAGFINADLRLLIEVVARACKTISTAISKGELGGVLGGAGTGNIQGEAQQKLDVLSNEIFLEANEWGGHLAGLASEEMEHSHPDSQCLSERQLFIIVRSARRQFEYRREYYRRHDFSVLRCPDGITEPEDEHFLQPGSAQVCAGYASYGPSTMLVLTTGRGTHGFTLDREQGSFVMTKRDMKIPDETKEFSVNSSNQRFWETPMQTYVDDMLKGKEGPYRDFNMRWIARWSPTCIAS